MSETQQKQSYSFTSIPSTSVRLGRLWVDYAESNNMPIRQRIGETSRYVWLRQTPRQWYSALLDAHWYIVGHSTGWNTNRPVGTPRIVSAARRAYRQLMRQSPKEWRDWLRDGCWGCEPVSLRESFTTWHVRFSRGKSDPGAIVCPHMPIMADPREVLVEGALVGGMAVAYDPIRDPESDDCWGLAWRVWCVAPEEHGWMVEYVTQVVPFVTLMYHNDETVCRKEGCSLCNRGPD